MTALVFTVGGRRCALPVEHVLETMRMLPIVPLDGMPAGVAGVAVVRGSRTPVVDLTAILATHTTPRRMVTVRTGSGMAALAVDEIEGLESFPPDTLDTRPSLLTGEGDTMFTALAVRDRALVLVLDAARVLPEARAEW